MNHYKSISAKRAWSLLTADRNRYKFAFIATLGLLYKSGQITREQVVDRLNEYGISRDDLRRFRGALPEISTIAT